VWAPLFAAEAGARAASALALLLALFPLGTIAASLTLRRVARRFDKRAAMLAAHAAASLALLGASLGSSLAAAAAGFALWGFCGGIFMTCGRARMLESRPPGEHARRLAALQLALLAASTAGAALAGLAATRLAVRPSLALFAAGSLAVIACAHRGVDRSYQTPAPPGPPARRGRVRDSHRRHVLDSARLRPARRAPPVREPDGLRGR
jgi:MFS family permease